MKKREIKFRAICVVDGQAARMIYFEPMLCDNGIFSFPMPNNVSHIDEYESPLMQFTGLHDKNGNPVYDGDTFQYTKHPMYLLDSFRSHFLWLDEYGCWGYKVDSEYFPDAVCALSIHDELKEDFLNHIEIIGNIYQHANLLSK